MAIIQLDVGKTNVKLVLADAETGAVLDQRSIPNQPDQSGAYPCFRTEAQYEWMVSALRDFAQAATVTDIVPVAHGAAVAVLDEGGLVLPILDYEHPGPDEAAAAWRRHRPDFNRSFSPELPGGLNFGLQLFWLEKRFPDQFANSRFILPLPQYWAWRLSGVAASEATSYGCHSDLWDMRAGRLAELTDHAGWSDRIPPFRNAWDVLGPITPKLADATGLPPDCRVRCGIHDSNASLLPWLDTQEAPFAVVSSGTWAIIFAVGGSLDGLDPSRDCLANVNVHRDPVPCARFMGGREYDLLVGRDTAVRSDPALIEQVAAEGGYIEPSLVAGVGPFGDRAGGWTCDPDTLDPVLRKTAAGYYIARMTAECLSLTSAAGPIIVEGPFADNRTYIPALARLTGRPVLPANSSGGTLAGALVLCRR
ncbi:MAG: hypothetical protein QNJ84_14785 [Alphaproteobacteria bacterium]|nr:hypothetical protein [Alphaproteobacteria bacterium]